MDAARAEAAAKQHNTVFFNSDLQPVVPTEGQWFCEFDYRDEMSDELRDEALVEYIGDGRVMPEGDEDDRSPRGVILVLQA